MRPFRIVPLALAACLVAAPVSASSLLITFDFLAQDNLVTGQFAGVTFSGATVYTSGASPVPGDLNEDELPPYSDYNVIIDSDFQIEATFDTGATSVGAYITYYEPVTMTAYSGSVILGSVMSAFSSNRGDGDGDGIPDGDPGSMPNEQFLFTSLIPITHVTFAGNPGGFSFALDDFSAELVDADQTPTPVPEPATASLVALGAALLIRKRKTRAARRA